MFDTSVVQEVITCVVIIFAAALVGYVTVDILKIFIKVTQFKYFQTWKISKFKKSHLED